MNRLAVRMLGVVMLLVFVLIFVQMYNHLQQLQRVQQKPPATQTR
jgi:hypothetical protein